MSEWMEILASFQEPEIFKSVAAQTTVVPLIVLPTVAIPLTAISVAISSIATMIAGLFGVQLHWEGPKKLLEVLLKPKVLATAIALNLVMLGAYQCFAYLKNYPSTIYRIKYENALLLGSSKSIGRGRVYSDYVQRPNRWNPGEHVKLGTSIRQTWKTQLPKGVFGGVTLSGHSLFVGSDDGYVYELERTDGKVLRRFFIGTEVTPQPIVYQSHLFVGEGTHNSHHSRIYSFDLKTGAFIGAFQTQGHVEGQPVIASFEGVTSLFVMAGKDGIYSLDPGTLKPKWHRLGGHNDSEVRVQGRFVYFSTGVEKGFRDSRKIAYALDFNTGDILWKVNLSVSGWMPPVVLENDVCFGLGEIYEATNSGELSCFNKFSGTPTSQLKLSSPVLGIPYYTGKNIVLSTLAGEVCKVSWPSLATQWCRPSSGKTYSSVSYAGKGRIIYPSEKEGIIELDEDTGNLLATWKPTDQEGVWNKTYSSVALGEDGWFVADQKGLVRKLDGRD